jgi:beta-1,4-mannosyltransferase
VVSIMALNSESPDNDCLYPAMEKLGVEVRLGVQSGRWLVKNLSDVDYVHIHWPSQFYDYSGRWRSIYGFAIFLFILMLARWRGARLVWTVHNLYPHEPCIIPRLDIWARHLLVRAASIFFVFGRAAAAEVAAEFPATRDRIVVIDHGHFIGYYPSTIERQEARARLGLDDREGVFLFFGLCKPYKNLEGLIEAFSRLREDATLVIAGNFQDPGYESRIRTLIAPLGTRVLLHAGYVRNEDVQIYFKACDVVVAPFLRILNSGTAILALSFGRPFIGPAFGTLREVIVKECGCLYEPSTPGGLESAMREALGLKFDESQILRHAERFDWAQSARVSLEALEDANNRAKRWAGRNRRRSEMVD